MPRISKTCDNFRAVAGSSANTLNFDHISQLIKREELLKKKKKKKVNRPKLESLVLSSRSEKQDLILILIAVSASPRNVILTSHSKITWSALVT